MDWIVRLLLGPLIVRAVILFVLPGVIVIVLSVFSYRRQKGPDKGVLGAQIVSALAAIAMLVALGLKIIIPEMPPNRGLITPPPPGSQTPMAVGTRMPIENLPPPPTQTSTPTFTPTPTPTFTPTPTPTPTSTFTPTFIPSPTPIPTYPCRTALARITLPHSCDVFASNEDVRIEGAMYRQGFSFYEVHYRPVDCGTGLPIGAESSWVNIGGRRAAPVGGISKNVVLAEWSSLDRSQQHVLPGCYQLAIKMINEREDAEWLEEQCRVIIKLR